MKDRKKKRLLRALPGIIAVVLAGILAVALMLTITKPYEAAAAVEPAAAVPKTVVKSVTEIVKATAAAETEARMEIMETSVPGAETAVRGAAAPETDPEWVCLGSFALTAYCSCEKCCGRWSGGPTRSGAMPGAGRTVAVDPEVVPLGTHLIIRGHEYIAEDTGSGVNGRHIDIYFEKHEDAVRFGRQKSEVWIRT